MENARKFDLEDRLAGFGILTLNVFDILPSTNVWSSSGRGIADQFYS